MDKLVDWRKDHVFIECDGDDVYLTNQWGDRRPLDDVEEIARLLLETAQRREKDIVIHNLEQSLYYEQLSNGKGRKKDIRPNPNPKYLYMFKCGDDRYKIGVSNDVARRLNDLNNRPYPVELYAASKGPLQHAFEIEKRMHEFHSICRLDGEWFIMEPEYAELAAEMVNAVTDDAIDDDWW